MATHPVPLRSPGRLLLVLLAATGCDDLLKSDTGDWGGSSAGYALEDFIGSPCETDADCPYDGGLCLPHEDGLPGGMCSAACDEYCPDESGHPTTFCVDASELSRTTARKFHSGACVSRCNYGAYPDGGCRNQYGCTRQPRYGHPDRETWACTPGEPDALVPACYQQLADRGVSFEADIRPPDPLPGTSRQCTIQAAVWLDRSVKGVRMVYEWDYSIDRTLAACSLGLALADTVDELQHHDVTSIRHMGTYACRTISGTSTPSRHAYGDAIDISGFTFRSGDTYTLVDDWEHNTYSDFDTAAGRWLYTQARTWHTDRLWSIILTPNYNTAHDDHFHIDLTPGSNYMGRETAASESAAGVVRPGFFGPAPYVD